MQINISTRHGHLGQASQEKICSKVEKILRFNDRVSAIEVTVDLEHPENPSVEVRVSVEKSGEFVATYQQESLAAAVDACVHKMEQQLRKHKEKTIDHRGAGRRSQVADLPAKDTPSESESESE